MLSRSRKPVLTLAMLLILTSVALAAWTPTTTGYTGAISTVRTNLATWVGTGVNASQIQRVTQSLLKAADKHFKRATSTLGTTPTGKSLVRSLSHVKDGVRLLEIAAKQDRKVAAFQTFVTNSNKSLYSEASKQYVAAGNYVTSNFGGVSKATRKLAKAGAKYVKAQAAAKATPPRYSKAIKLIGIAIGKLGKAKLL